MSDYRTALKKLKKEEEEQTVAPSSYNGSSDSWSSFMSDYHNELDRLQEENVKTTVGKMSQRNITSTVGTLSKDDDDRKWYEKGHFEDGYDFGDISKTILGISDKKKLKTFEAPDTTDTLEELKKKRDYLNNRTWHSAEQTADALKYTQQYNQMALYQYADTLSKTKMDGQNHTVLEEIEILANMESGKEKDKRKQAVLDKMESLGMDSSFYAHFAGDGEFDWKTFGEWAKNASLAGLNTFNKGLLDTADVLLGAPLKALGWENNPISEGAEYYNDLYSTYRYNANLLAEKLGGNAWNFGTDAIEGTAGALPNALLMFMTGGASATTTTNSLMNQAAMQTGNILTKAGITTSSMAKNPQFWMSFARTLGSDYQEAKEMGASDLAASVGSVLKSTVNAGIEIGPDGGSGIQGLGDALKDGGKPFWEWVESWVEEGGEEILQKFVGEVVDKFGYGSDEDILNPIEYAKEGTLGMLSGMALGGGQTAVQSGVNAYAQHQANKLTDMEQSVMDKIVEKKIAQKEKDGKTLTAKEKADIEKEVERNLRKGYLKAEEIEEAIGGEVYESYKAEQDKFFASDAFQKYDKTKRDSQKRIKKLEKQLEEIGNQPNTVANSKKYDAIQNRIDILKKRTQSMHDSLLPEANRIIGIKEQMRSSMMGTVKDSRLAETYRELERKKQKFQVDVNQYKNENAKKTVQSILDSGLGDNSNQFHETVEWLAKLSEDRNVTFDLTKTELLKGTEHYREGYVTNGFKTKNGDLTNITINLDGNVLNTTVGHEITHVLEEAGIYEDLSKAVREFAISKEGQEAYNARLSAIKEIYGDDQATIDSELTADIIGEYLFADYDFIHSLSTQNRNVFQKIYDEIKYMVKIATAGSKEARDLERVKKMFDKAWRENVKGKPETKTETNTEPQTEAEVESEVNEQYSIRKEAPPTKTEKAYKLMRLVDGDLYPLFIGNNEKVSVGTWYNADSPNLSQLKDLPVGTHLVNMETGEAITWDEYAEQYLPKKNGQPVRSKPNKDDIHWANDNGYRFMHIEDKTGASANRMMKQYGDTRAYYNWGVNGSAKSDTGEGSASLYALRPGWHFGEVPSMHQIGYGENKDVRLDNQVWVEVDMSADVDYNEEAASNWGGDIPTHIPTDGYYKFATNPTQKKTKSGTSDADNTKADWYVAGAFKVNRILSDTEADAIVNQYNQRTGRNVPLDHRRSGNRVFNAETMSVEDSPVKSLEGGSVTKYSLSTWTPEMQKKVSQNLVSAGFAENDVEKWIADTNGIAAVIASDKARLDFEAHENHTMVKDNNEYYKTVEASTLCAKRLKYQGTFDAIQHRLPNTTLTSDMLIELREMMKKNGHEVPCGACYVESRRRHLGKYATDWLKTYDGEYIPTLADVTTTNGLEKLRIEHPQTYDDFIAAMNKKGVSNPKVVELRTEYKGEIMKIPNSTYKKIMKIGGLRLQSFSDFETPHLLDMMQVVHDMASRKFVSQAYTKVPNFAWVLGDTNIKINLSLIPSGTGVDANGELTFDPKEGMDINEAMRLRDRYSKNVGTTIIGINDEHILKCMADDRIDYIIPFHRSGWGSTELKAMGLDSYIDYTKQQRERDIETGKGVDNIDEMSYWDFSKTGKENAETYLALCAEKGVIPKFDKFLVNNGDGSYSLQPDGSTDGYWKTLINFKMYDNDGVGSPHQAVVPNFNMEEAHRVLNEYEGGANSLPVANDVVEEFVKKYQENIAPVKPTTQYSMSKDSDGNQLTQAQEEFFKDSQIRDDNGNLMPMYHGTKKGGFTVFDGGKDYWYFTNDPKYADTFEGRQDNGEYYPIVKEGIEEGYYTPQKYSVYLNVTNPFITDDIDIIEDALYWDKTLPEQLRKQGYDALMLEDMSQVIVLNQNQIKNMDNQNPTADPDIRYSMTKDSKQQSYHDYLEAVNSGDTDTAQKLLDGFAKDAGYNYRGVHRSFANFTVFDREKIGSNAGTRLGDGFYVTLEFKDDATARYADSAYGENRMELYVKMESPLVLGAPLDESIVNKMEEDFSEFGWFGEDSTSYYAVTPEKIKKIFQSNDGYEQMETIRLIANRNGMKISELLNQYGFDSVIDENDYVKQAVVFDETQLKSAEPVTYDEYGDVIMPYERFNQDNMDIRYSISKGNRNDSGDWHIDGREFGYHDEFEDFAPIREDVFKMETTTESVVGDKIAPTVSNVESVPEEEEHPVKPTKEKLNDKLVNRKAELDKIQKLRQESAKSYDEKIAKAKEQLDAKKDKDTKVANSLKMRIERLQRLKSDIDAKYAKRIQDITKGIDKVSEELEKDHTEKDRYAEAKARIERTLATDKAALQEEYAKRKTDLQGKVSDKNAYISNMAKELYDELRSLRKGVRASANLGSLLDAGLDWGNLKSALSTVRYNPSGRVNLNSAEESAVRQLIDESYENDVYGIDDLDIELAEKIQELETQADEKKQTARRTTQRYTKSEEHTKMWKDLIGDTSTWVDLPTGLHYKTQTLRRILRKVVKDANGKADIKKADAIYDALETKYDHNEALLKRESAKLKEVFQKLNLNHAEDQYAQMLGELRHNPDTTLSEDVVKEFFGLHKHEINEQKVNKAIEESRKLYDDLLVRVNGVLREQGFKEIPYRKGYFPHFTNPKQNWLQKALNWKPTNDEIPTSIAGLTEMFKPSRSWQSFNKQRMGDKTDYSLYQGLDTYIHGALDWIYHIEDLQERRSLENLIRYTHSEEGVKQKIDEILKGNYDADEAQSMINAVLAEANNPLGGLVRELMNRTNTLANKKSSMDRAVEDLTSRKVYSVMTNLNNRITANQVVGSFSSALTNFIPMVQSWHQVSPWYTARGMGDYIRSVVKDDGMVEKSDFLTNRLMEEEKLYQTGWDKVSDKAGFMMNVVDSITSNTVWRSKYLQNLSEGMSETQAIKDADQFAKNLMAGRSRGNAPTIFDAKNPLVKMFTAFQLEVANQYGYMFDDVIKDSKSKTRLVKGYATAFLGAYAYNALYSSLVGRDAAFDPISIIEELLSGLFDDEEEKKDVLMDFGTNILEEVPFVGGMLGGGRIPLSSAFPYSGYSNPVESMLTDISEGEFSKEWLKPLWYLAMPVGGGQVKKTIEGLSMFSDDHPVTGSYTDSGNLRFPVEDTFGNRVQAAMFGQYANKNARDYFDNNRKALYPDQIQEYKDLDIPIRDYWDYREGLAEFDKWYDKADYIANLDLPVDKRNILINNISTREDPIDLRGYEEYDNYEEFDWAIKNPEKYDMLSELGVSYSDYKNADEEKKKDYNWAVDYPKYVTLSKAVTNDVWEYREWYKDMVAFKADKDKNGKSISGTKKRKVIDYINSLDIDYGAKLVLMKSQYESIDDYNEEIFEYIRDKRDLTFEEKLSILKTLGYGVSDDGNVTWD
jgi:hypothetical protein